MFEHKILLATDLTDTSRAAESTAFALAKRLQVKLVMLHVILERASFGMSTTLPELDDPAELTGQLQALGQSEAPEAERLLLHGSPAEIIVNVAQSESVDFIVVGTAGRKGIARAVLGSIAEAVVRDAPCPVMVVKSDIDDEV